MSILVIGSVALDTVSTPFGKIEDGLGGSATHFSVSASYFTDVNLVAVVGDDFPQKHLNFLKSKKINIDGIEIAKGRSFRWEGQYDYDLNNAQTLKTELNVFEAFSPKVPPQFKKPNILFLANVDPTLQYKVIDQVEKPALIALDTMNFWIQGKKDELKKVLSRIDFLTINEGEARLLTGQSSLKKAAIEISKMGPQIIVIKQGEYGALLFHNNQVFSAPGLPLEDIKDPTGAGDSFAGGMMGYLDRTKNFSFEGFKQAVIYGSVMASYNVEAFSCDRLRTLTMDEIRRRYSDFKKLAHFDEVQL